MKDGVDFLKVFYPIDEPTKENQIYTHSQDLHELWSRKEILENRENLDSGICFVIKNQVQEFNKCDIIH